MKVEITSKPQFRFELSQLQVNILLKLSSVHYDGVCKDAGVVGGFVYGWNNMVSFRGGQVSAAWRELDTALKIMEQAELYTNNRLISEAELLEVYKLRRAFTAAFRGYEEVIDKWTHTVESA